MKVKVITTTDGKILGITQEPPLALGQDEPRAVVVPTTDQIMRETEGHLEKFKLHSLGQPLRQVFLKS